MPASPERHPPAGKAGPTGPTGPVVDWICRYLQKQKEALDSIPQDAVARLVDRFRAALAEDRQIFVFGNGGSAANASHFATDLGKGASDVSPSRFRILSLNDNSAWMTALGNDYSFEEVFVRQLQNYARPGDLALCMSVSGNSPNLVRAMRWARDNGLVTVALVGAKRGGLADIVEHLLVIPDTHYGRVEDAQMTICHMLSYAFMEAADGAEGGS
jgi:D-sedoheptulose 7-phosphate isomerase